jgi:hypothetical protein
MFDYFVAELHCPHCSAVSAPTALTGMQTHLRGDADGSELGVGYVFDPADLKTNHILGAGYALIESPATEGTLRLLEVWTCPACETEQWAVVEIVRRRIERIEAVRMNRPSFEAANFISEVNAELLAAALTGLSPADFAERNLSSVEILRQRLD